MSLFCGVDILAHNVPWIQHRKAALKFDALLQVLYMPFIFPTIQEPKRPYRLTKITMVMYIAAPILSLNDDLPNPLV